MKFADHLRQLPPISHLAAIEFLNPAGEVVDSVENRPGKAGSLAVYAALAQLHGPQLTREAALQGLTWFAEHAEDAWANPGKHHNIDRLFWVRDQNLQLSMRLIPINAT